MLGAGPIQPGDTVDLSWTRVDINPDTEPDQIVDLAPVSVAVGR